MEPESLLWKAATWLIPLTFAIVFHEVAHGLVARAFGDTTASERGRLSLNPIRHIDPVGTIILPMLLALASAPIFGWAKPVPVVAARMRNPRWNMVLVALAGPAMNLLLALTATIIFGGILRVTGFDGGIAMQFLVENLRNFLVINVMLAVFNLLPLPPFDGGHVVQGLLPRPLAMRYARLAKFGMIIPLVLFVALPMIAPEANLLARLIGPPVELVLGLLSQVLGRIVGMDA